jgi:hypothetical protein
MSNSSNGALLESPKCPLDDRRSATELYVTHFVIHFTVIAAYCHLLSIRNEPFLSLKPVFFIFTPLLFILQHVLALISIGGKYLYESILCQDENATFNAYSSLGWLFGRMPTHREGYSSLPKTSSRKSSMSEETNPFNSEHLAKKMGRTLVVLALVAQCIGTIFLYIRRLQHDAVGLVDHRTLEFACAGLLVALLNICVIWRIPVFAEPIPRGTLMFSKVNGVVASLRDITSMNGPDYRDNELARAAQFVMTAGLAWVSLVITGQFDLFTSVLHLVDARYWDKPFGEVDGEFVTAVIMALLAILPTFVLVIVRPVANCVNGTGRFRRRDAALVLCLPVVFFLIFLLFMFMIGSIITLFIVLGHYGGIFEQISETNQWPIDRDCGVLWQDPMAQYIWWLA